MSTRVRRRVTVVCALLAGGRGRRAHPARADATDVLGIGLGPARRTVLGGLHPAQPHRRAARAPAWRARRRRERCRRWSTCRSGSRRCSRTRRPPPLLACAAAAGVLSSAVPFLADLLALRRVPAHSFGIFMSVSPVVAAAIGTVVLGETLAPIDWLAIGLIVTANAASIVVTPAAPPRPGRRRCPCCGGSGEARARRATRGVMRGQSGVGPPSSADSAQLPRVRRDGAPGARVEAGSGGSTSSRGRVLTAAGGGRRVGPRRAGQPVRGPDPERRRNGRGDGPPWPGRPRRRLRRTADAS